MTCLNWKSDAPATVIRPLPKGNGIIHLNGTSGVILCERPDLRMVRALFLYARALGGYIEAMPTARFAFAHARILALEDGRIFEGESFGATGTASARFVSTLR